ncbi:response regulator [Gaetbulibacter aestuarii]|uniref:Response regulator n=1 Tax=Gaetbulibacter aestuarii TaxID=1502358 RepID=A0ABW7MY01_9FLAO
MTEDKTPLNILFVEDNPGDILLIQDYLDEYFKKAHIDGVTTFAKASELLLLSNRTYDVILLDLNLPDKEGDELIKAVLEISKNAPVIVLTGYTDLPFMVSIIKKGVYDYLLKDEISGFSLYKSILHNIDRRYFREELQLSSKRYSNLFQLSSQPIIVFNSKTFAIEEVNNAALVTYGYTKEEFLNLKKIDLYYEEDLSSFVGLPGNKLNTKEKSNRGYKGVFRHIKKNGEVIFVEVFTIRLGINDQNISVVIDVTDKLNYTKAIENQNKKLKEIAWMQSHVLRAPLARMMGLIELIKINKDEVSEEILFYLEEILKSSNEFDTIIKEISQKTSLIVDQ